jgi:murein DD-endopeptidase MepM/ murein hydrolase activator NlpD
MSYDITAFNHGNAPVIVAMRINPDSTRNISTDKTLPLTAVVPPHTDQAVVHVGPKNKKEPYNFSYTYSWSIGDSAASHRCPEHYRFPFGDNIRAFASVSDNASSTPFTRYAVVFSMPVGTPVLAARKGTVVRINDAGDKIDILHDDSTIATYSHLGKLADSVVVGKAVSTDDVIGIADTVGTQNQAYLQLTVWRPEPLSVASATTNTPGAAFDLVSFPLEFCNAGSSECGVLTQSQAVSRNKVPEAKKQGKSASKPATRKNGSS